MSTSITYKGQVIASFGNSTKTLNTAGTWLEDDITVTATDSAAAVTTIQELDEHGGIIKHINAIDLSNDTVDAAHLLQGYTAHDRDGNAVTGTYTGGSGGGTTINNQNKTVTPTESQQSVTADTGYTGLGTVTVNAIPTTYIGSGVTQRTSSNLTVNGATVTAPAGYYTNAATKSVASGTAGTPTATKGTVSNNSITVTPSVTNTTGYITGGTKTGTAVSVSASELVSGTKSITENGNNIDVTNYQYVNVNTPGGSGTYALTNIVPSQTVATTTSNLYGYVGLIPSYTEYVQSGQWYLVTYDNTEYVCTGYYGANSEILVGDYQLITSNVEWLETPFIVEYNLTNNYFFLGSRTSGNHTIKVDKLTILDEGVTLQTKTISYTPSETQQASTITADSGYDGLNTVNITVNAIPTTYVGSGVTQRTSSNLTASGATVTAPAGYYAAAATKSVASGSAQTPNTTISVTPTISINSSGLITASASTTKNITPTVTAGYVSSGSAGTVTVSGSNTSQLSTQAATTYNVSSSNQTISSGKYLTGNQTIRGVTVSGLAASNIANGVTVKVGDAADDDRITSVTGTLSFVSYYTGSGDPSSSLGQNNDIYLKVVS